MTSTRYDEGGSLVIGDAEVGTLPIETGETVIGDLLLASPHTFALGIGHHVTLEWTGRQAQALTAVGAILGRAGLPASRQARFDPFPSASEARGIESPGDLQEQDGKKDQQEPVEIKQLVEYELRGYLLVTSAIESRADVSIVHPDSYLVKQPIFAELSDVLDVVGELFLRTKIRNSCASNARSSLENVLP